MRQFRWMLTAALLASTVAAAEPKALIGRWGIFGEELCELKPNGDGVSPSTNTTFRWMADGRVIRFLFDDGRIARFRYNLAGDHLILGDGPQTIYTFRLDSAGRRVQGTR